MSEPEEYYIDGPSYIESSELEEVMDEVNDRLKKLESKLAASDGQAIESSEGEPLHAGLATLTANEVINRLKITPIDMVDILNGINIYDDYNNIVDRRRLVTTDEGRFRAHTYSEPYFTEEMLKNVKIYQLKFDQYCDEWGIQPSSKAKKADTSALESQLAEAKKQLEDVEGVRRWNKQFLTEREELRKSLEEKDARIAGLESQLAEIRSQVQTSATTNEALQEKDARIAALQAENESIRKHLGRYGALAVVIKMIEKGYTEVEIAKHLKEGGLSYSQVGVLLHESPLTVGDSAITMRAKRLLGIA